MLSPPIEAAPIKRTQALSREAQLQARRFAAAILEGAGRADLACMALNGDGDDFPEVIAAGPLFQDQLNLAAGRDQAIKTYADPDFWDEELPGGSLASHDQGEMARNVLSGYPPFHHWD